ncbi:MAG: prolyl oligopeptidase family serine peptidase, partial [Chitinophagaceae bacterium]|nr:prolyl oligopeptidase family serine peptidase [Chitinophagaceae bacterium]
MKALTSVNEGVSAFEEEAGKLLFVKTEVANPFELYLADGNAANQQRVSAFNHEWVSKKTLSFPEKRSFKNEKGMEVEYWVMKPANWQAGKKYPTILEIHGGPSAMWGPGESSMWHEYQYYCAKGYAVVYANPRGSGGYGEAFLRGNINDWGQGPMSDVL